MLLSLVLRKDARRELAGVPVRELVPGDIVRVRPGDIIPAECFQRAPSSAGEKATPW